MVEAGPGFGDGGGIGQHADGALHLGQVTSGHNGWRLKHFKKCFDFFCENQLIYSGLSAIDIIFYRLRIKHQKLLHLAWYTDKLAIEK